MNRIVLAALAALALVGAYVFWMGRDGGSTDVAQSALPEGALVEVALPEALSENAVIGKRAFEAHCATCHGVNAVGREGAAPPLVHIIYEPSHHGDESFQRAVAYGVQAHHWPFGNMPAIEGLTRGDVTLITAYIRELQQANGIN